MKKAQAGLEILISIGAVMLALGCVTVLMYSHTDDVSVQKAKRSLETLSDVAKRVQMQGTGASETVELFIPDNVISASAEFDKGELSLTLYNKDGNKDIVVPVDTCISGQLPTKPGTYQLTITGGQCANVQMQQFSVSPSQLVEWLKRGDTKDVSISIHVEAPVPVTISVDDGISQFADLDINEPGLQSSIQVSAPVEQTIRLQVPVATAENTYKGKIFVQSDAGSGYIAVDIIVYSTSFELKTYIDPSHTIESDYFYIDGPLPFRTVSRRNNLLYTNQVNYSFTNPDAVVVDARTVTANSGIYEGYATGVSYVGTYTITATDPNADETLSKEVEGVKRVGWRIIFDQNGPALSYPSDQNYAEVRFRLVDQSGIPITNLGFTDSKMVIPFSGEDWSYYQQSCAAPDPCIPSDCPVPGNWSTTEYDASGWPLQDLPSYYNSSGGDWICTGCVKVFRKHFTLEPWDLENLGGIKVNYQCDEGCECYLNGYNVFSPTTCQYSYPVPILADEITDPASLSKLRVGDNVMTCRVVESTSQIIFRHFDTSLELIYKNQARVSLREMISPAPNLDSFLNISQDGDWYVIGFSPSQLANNTSQAGPGNFVLDVWAEYNGIPVEHGISFNIVNPLTNQKGYDFIIENPSTINVPDADLDLKVLLLDQIGTAKTNDRVIFRVYRADTNTQIKKCDISSASADNRYHCLVSAGILNPDGTYIVSLEDKTVLPKGLKYMFSFNVEG